MEALRAPVRDGGDGDDGTWIRELGARPVPTYAAHRKNERGERELVVVETLLRGDADDHLAHTARLMHDARWRWPRRTTPG